MKNWSDRPLEIRNLFNPAFCGLILSRAISGYANEEEEGLPFSLALLILPLALHKDTREEFARGNRSYMLKIIGENPQMLVGFHRRVTDMLPYTFEALGLLMKFGCFEVTPAGKLKPVPDTVKKTISGTEESVSCQRVAKYLGREFARVSDRMTIYTSLGIRP